MVVLGGYKQENGSRPAPVAHVGEWMYAHPGWTLEVRVWRPTEVGGAYYLAADTEIRDGVLWWTPTATDTAIEGKGRVQIWARDGEKAFAVSELLVTQVLASISTDEQAPPTPMKPWLDKLVEQVEAARDEAAASAAEAASTAAGIVTDEAARQEAESKRVAAETARKQAEETRAANERLRESAESERVKAENARKTAEANREQAETAREQEMAEALESVTDAENAVRANEQQRVLAERARVAQEQARKSAEQSRAKAEQARGQAEQRRETAETSRTEAERQRESMETSRQTAETARNAAESGRAKAEKARETAESQRQQAETARADAESKRVQAEQKRVTAEQGRVEAEAQREEAMTQHAEKIAALEAEVAKKAQIDDTTVSGSEAWSSQHIVDMLCPPLEASGNPVVCYPVAGSKLGVTASWEPTQEGEGTPSPDNIRAIHGRDSVSITRQEDELSMALTLPSTIYGGKVGAEEEGKETWAKVLLPKTGWTKDNSTSFTRFNHFEALPLEAQVRNSQEQFSNILCNALPSAETSKNEDGIQLETGNKRMVRISCKSISTIDDFLIWIESNQVEVAYKLATPVPFTATGGGAIKALSGTNTILTDADALTVTGRADPIHIIQQLQAASAASAQALADVERAVTDI